MNIVARADPQTVENVLQSLVNTFDARRGIGFTAGFTVNPKEDWNSMLCRFERLYKEMDPHATDYTLIQNFQKLLPQEWILRIVEMHGVEGDISFHTRPAMGDSFSTTSEFKCKLLWGAAVNHG